MTNKLSKHEFFMQKAYEQALLAYENGEVPIGAVLVKTDDDDKKVIAESFNKTLILTDPTADTYPLGFPEVQTDCHPNEKYANRVQKSIKEPHGAERNHSGEPNQPTETQRIPNNATS